MATPETSGRKMWETVAIIVALATLSVGTHGQASTPAAAANQDRPTVPVAAPPVGSARTSKAPAPKQALTREASPAPTKAQPTRAKAVWNLLNSEFVAALVAGVVGAGVGAYGGAEIVRRQQERKSAREEVRAVNVAIAHVLFILNWTIALKRQHVRDMAAKYKADCDHREAILKLPGPQVLEFTVDMQTLPLVELPIPPLKATVYDRLDAPGTAYAMCATLASALDALRSTMEQRNDLIAEVQRGPERTELERAEFYFGLPRSNGVLDARYPGMLDAISHYSDASILYGMIMAALLMEHGNDVAKAFGKNKPKVTSMNIAAVFADGLVPDLEEYRDMLQNMGINAARLLTKYGAPAIPQAPANSPSVPAA